MKWGDILKFKRWVFISLVVGVGIATLFSGFTIYNEYEARSAARQMVLRYYEDFQAGDDESIYELLHPESREGLGKENIMTWLEQLRETMEIESFEIKDIQLKNNLRMGENSVADGISVQVSETNRDLYTTEVLSSEIQYLLLRNVQGEYRIYFDQRRVLSSMAKNHIIIGAMYIDGFGKDKDLTQGIEHLYKALEIDPTLIEAHYSLGAAYLAKREWEPAIVEEETYLTNSQDDEGRGEAYNIIGLAYQETGDRAKAREAFEQAIQLNPESPFALDHLNELNNE